mmetsp:Transcript_23940/g.69111  ORF Transcript_23940/g.69111 Transcript_23940/m.69111 type:complete len:205 (+) Transcript_23940:455-1069(+)
MPEACSAYVRVEIVSSTTLSAGEMVAMITVLQRPPRASCSSRVSFESRYGTRPELSRSEEMTRPRVSRLWLIERRSRSSSSWPGLACPGSSPAGAPPFFAHSLPARSTRCSFPVFSSSPTETLRRQRTFIVKMLCERLLRAFTRVSATRRRSCARWTRSRISFVEDTATSERPRQQTPLPLPVSLRSSFGCWLGGARRSLSSSL